MDDAIYDEDVNYDALEQHTYEDSGDAVFYTCPLTLSSETYSAPCPGGGLDGGAG